MKASQKHWQNRNKEKRKNPRLDQVEPVAERAVIVEHIPAEIPSEAEFIISVEPTYDEAGFLLLDGSEGEGGGQILRMSLALAGILKKPIKITNIRANRSATGLGIQHVSVVQLLKQIYSAKVSEFEVGTSELTFEPNDFTPCKKFLCHSATASAITLMMQACLPSLIFGSEPCSIEFQGGTHVSKAPYIEYMVHAVRPLLQRFGAQFDLNIKKKGYLAAGGGLVEMNVTPVAQLNAISILERGRIETISVLGFHAGTVHVEVPQRMVHDAFKRLEPFITTHPDNSFDKEKILCEIIKEAKANGSASGLTTVVTTDTGGMFCTGALGGRGVNAEKVSKTAVSLLLKNLKKGGAVDEFLQDQLIIYCALAKGKSSIRCGPITRHTMSIIHLTRMLTGANILIVKTKLPERVFEEEKSYIIHINGIGFTNPSKLATPNLRTL